MTINWDAIAATSNVLSALFVGATLIYLTVQLRDNGRTVRTEALNTAIGMHVMQIASLTNSLERTALVRKFIGDFYALTLDERGVVLSLMLERTATFNQVMRLHEAALLDDREFSTMQRTYISILKTKGGRQWWAAYKHMVPQFLNDYITKTLDDPTLAIPSYTEALPWLFANDQVNSSLPNSEEL